MSDTRYKEKSKMEKSKSTTFESRKKFNGGSNNIQDADTYINEIIHNMTDEKLKESKHDADKLCAPGLKFEGGSCARLVVLKEMAKAYNKMNQNPNDQIKFSETMETLHPHKYKKYLVDELDKRIGPNCSTQKCWGTQEFINHMDKLARSEYLKYTHKPNSPQGRFTWLSTTNIDDVIRQYEKTHKDFKYFGAVPMDFATLPQYEISSVNYKELYDKGIRRLGIVFNLDYSGQPGSHWVSMFTDFNKGTIYYFDSVGKGPTPEVRDLMNLQKGVMKSLGIKNVICDHNKTQHQKKNTECGVYSIYFILQMLNGKDFYDMNGGRISDDEINKYREIFFDKYHLDDG
jgi:hypothetical protein